MPIIESKYQEYLKMVSLKESEMSGVQRIETRRAFYGAWGLFSNYLSEDVPEWEMQLRVDAMHDEMKAFVANKMILP